jgi:cytochrome c oxidase cbb3-type subunit III
MAAMFSKTPALRVTVVLIALIALAIAIGTWTRSLQQRDELVRMDPGRILMAPAMLELANSIARPLYVQHCSGCHGGAFQGDPSRGVPDLAKGVWLYGNDPVDVERTILYGIRSGHPKARNLTDMPALVRTGQITPDDARDAVQYLQSLAGSPSDQEAANRGRSIYYNKGNCYDCHANDARGVTDYGTPALTGPVYLYGGDPRTLYLSILNGRHGECPAWVNVLSPSQIRALTLYLITAASRAGASH